LVALRILKLWRQQQILHASEVLRQCRFVFRKFDIAFGLLFVSLNMTSQGRVGPYQSRLTIPYMVASCSEQFV
jgi:hypothetical protein